MAVRFSVAVCLGLLASSQAAEIADLVPRKKDYGQIWWVDGFPTHREGARWLRKIETGYFSFALNTETLAIPEFGRPGETAELELGISVNGKEYTATGGAKWTRTTGPRLVESGCFFQRMDVTDLEFRSAEGEKLGTEARFEVAAWPDRLGMILSAKPGRQSIQAGEASFGKVGGGYGLTGKNDFVVPHDPAIDPEAFTLELDVFVPSDYQATKVSPWLVCKNRNEAANGNYGLMIVSGKAVALMNVDGPFRVESRPLRLDAWSKLSLSYDGDTMRLHVNGRLAGEKKIGKARKPGRQALAFGRREDNHGSGYRFRGVIDEIKFFDHKISKTEPVRHWGFRKDGVAASQVPMEKWENVETSVRLKTSKGMDEGKSSGNEASLVVDPATGKKLTGKSPVVVKSDCPVEYQPSLGWHRMNLDKVKPMGQGNDIIERIKFSVSNPSDHEEVARLMFEKVRGFRGRLGSAITGVSAILCDANGLPTGIPVQLSKNWHRKPEKQVYDGQWFHGITQLRLPPGAKVDLQLVIANAHWGGVAAASHAQLSLIGWGGNSLWEQSALGCWGESICYDPDQALANTTITDVRPLMVAGKGSGKKWSWTNNMGGGDFFRFYDGAGKRVAHSEMKTRYHKYGPCLTEVEYEGRVGEAMKHRMTMSLGRTDDVVRGTYRVRLDIEKATEFSRFVFFQVGSDSYNFTKEAKMAVGNREGLVKEWQTQWGGNTNRGEVIKLAGEFPWISLHEAVKADKSDKGAVSNRGIVVRSWKARIGGKEVAPWVVERGQSRHGNDSSTIDFVPPPGVTRFEAADYVEATFEHIMMPQFAKDYYGPNEELRKALDQDENTWRMMHRESGGNSRKIEVTAGRLEQRFPDVRIGAVNGGAKFSIEGGLGYVSITLTGLTSHKMLELRVDGQVLDQSVHGNDFWQCNYDPVKKSWSQTFNVPLYPKNHTIELSPKK